MLRLFKSKPPAKQAYAVKNRPPVTPFTGPSSYASETLGTPDAWFSPVVYACVSRISRTLSTLPRIVRKESNNEEIPSPFWIENPNTYQSGNDFVKSIVFSLLLWGEAFLVPARNNRAEVVSVAVINPLYVSHYIQSNTVLWHINGIPFTGELIHLRNDALPGKIRGYYVADIMRPLTETNRIAQQFLYKVVEQGGAYQLAVLFPEGTDTEDAVVQDTALQIISRHAGPDGAYLPLVLAGGARIEQLNQSNADGQFMDLSDMTAKNIAQFEFGIDDTMLGFKSDQPQIYQNAPSVWHRYWAFACKHLHAELVRAYTLMLPRGTFMDIDESEVLLGGPHDRMKIAKEMASVNKTLGLKIYTEDEIRILTGKYPLPEYEELKEAKQDPPPNLTMPEGMLELGDGEDDESEEEESNE